MKNLLFISRPSPSGSGLAREALDAVLGASVYGQNLSLLFMDDGVFQLLKNQDPQKLQQKRLSANLSALPLYEVENLFVHSESLTMRGIDADQLIFSGEELTLLDNQQVAELMCRQDQLLSF